MYDFRIEQGTRNGEGMFVLRYIVNQGTKQSKSNICYTVKDRGMLLIFASTFPLTPCHFSVGRSGSNFARATSQRQGAASPNGTQSVC